ncbi:hypothetical protein [Nevskia sp.]|uniref:hypothetical protein n=1 Tax=Nevskia sp. TaxID=1929292 RepID=UPI0025EF9B5E|nr:hypothetical protein [Nevskia sp.]
MNERAISFGESGSLFGILSQPDVADPLRPAVLIPNTGVSHRAGPSRMHVELARALAAAGVVSLRIDNAGLGDSEPIPGRLGDPFAPDLRAAMDALDARNLSSGYIVLGIHSGAHDAHQAARGDPRVVGAAFIDGYTHRTPRYWINRTMDRLADSARRANAELRPQIGLTRQSGDALHDALLNEIHYYDLPTAARMQLDLVEFMRREMSLLYIYTGDVENEYNYPGQLIEAFPLLRGYRRMTLRHIPEADHRFIRRASREAMIDVLVSWVIRVPGQPH